jgi:Cu2+-exporting ATPase
VRGQIVHARPGRLRLRYRPAWLKARRAAIEADLGRIPGVRAVSTRELTGSVVVEYDPAHLGEPALLATLAGALRSDDEEAPVQSRAGGEPGPADRSRTRLLAVSTVFAASYLPLPGPVVASLVLASALPLLERAGRTLSADRRLNVDVLDATTLVALVLRRNYRAAALLVSLLSLGQHLLDRTVQRGRRSLRERLAEREREVWREEEGRRVRVPIAAVRAGDTVVVRAGEVMPADGTVVRGEALVDQQRVTGEGLPVERIVGDRVHGSTVVEDGEIAVRVDRVGADTSVGRIIAAIEAAEGEKPELQLFAENLADRLVLPTLGAAALGAAVTRNPDSGIAILVADYGTPVRVAIPTVATASKTRALREGILLKGPSVLERLARVDTVVFDKTGTLTLGAPRVSRVVTYDPARSADEILAMAAAAERGFRHPVARAVVRLAESRGLDVPKRTDTEARVGLGIRVRVGGVQVLVGSRRFMESHGIALDRAVSDESRGHVLGASATFVAFDGRLAGLLLLQDELRSDAQSAVSELRARNMRNVIMVSGDHPEPTRVIAESLGVRHYYPDLLPEDKAVLIRRLRAEGRVVAMVGDGVNDALALDQADVGIAVPGGVEVVAEAAGVLLLHGGLDRVVRALDLARGTMVMFRRVVDVAVGANLVVVGLASLGLAGPFTSILLSNGATVAAGLYARPPEPRRGASPERPPSR